MSDAIQLVTFILRDMDTGREFAKSPFPDLLTFEEEGSLPHIPMAEVSTGGDLRRAALELATMKTGLGNFSSIHALPSAENLSVWLIRRKEPFGSLSRWRHVLDGKRILLRWTPLDGLQRLASDSQKMLQTFEQDLLKKDEV